MHKWVMRAYGALGSDAVLLIGQGELCMINNGNDRIVSTYARSSYLRQVVEQVDCGSRKDKKMSAMADWKTLAAGSNRANMAITPVLATLLLDSEDSHTWRVAIRRPSKNTSCLDSIFRYDYLQL